MFRIVEKMFEKVIIPLSNELRLAFPEKLYWKN